MTLADRIAATVAILRPDEIRPALDAIELFVRAGSMPAAETDLWREAIRGRAIRFVTAPDAGVQ